MEEKTVGIWMDHSTAEFIELEGKETNHSIDSTFNLALKDEALSRSESIMHNKENQLTEAFYKKIGVEILKYDRVLLFGPTHAKLELHNYLNKDLHFKDIQIDVLPADKMTHNEKSAFVKTHFLSNQLKDRTKQSD